ncbi:MAG: fasciclin domain-containing protein [Phycisphaerae bacterium]|nr:fasciclin domain-containing protein [Phycisphaerae bacterium]
MKVFLNIKSLIFVCLLAGLVLFQAGCENEADAWYGGAKKDIVETAASAGDFGTLVTAIKAADLVDTLKGHGPFTVFAPTNEAFAKLPEGTLDNLLMPENKEKLASILTYHVVSGKITSAKVAKLKSAKTVNGKEVYIRVVNGDVMINSSRVTKTDIKCSNGVIHVIDTVLMP